MITHRRSEETQAALMKVIEVCERHAVQVVIPASEVEKYSMEVPPEGVSVVDALDGSGVDVCVALGGDGTILRAFNRFDWMRVPVFGVNFGRVGFLSAVEPDDLEAGISAVLNGEYEIFELSLVELDLHGKKRLALNDVVVHKPNGGSIIRLGYSIGDIFMDSVSGDGLVAATPAGSTAYNLATGGPLVSLRLDAMILTAIAPHSLSSRPIVIGPEDRLTVRNESISAVASVYVDGRNYGDLAPGSEITGRLSSNKARLVQLAGANFYRKLRDKFIRPPRA